MNHYDVPVTILIVEDDADQRAAFRALLASTAVSNGLEGLRVAHERRPDVILLDLMMPTMDGFEFLAVRLADPALAHIPVIVMSASSFDRLGEFGVAAHLEKPFTAAALCRTIARHVAAG